MRNWCCLLSCLLLGAACAQDDSTSGWGADGFAPPELERFFILRPPTTRAEVVRRFVHEQLSAISPEAFDVMGYLEQGVPRRLGRGLKFGLVTGSAAYSLAELGGGDSWLLGSVGLAAGFTAAALADVNWPPTFTVRYGEGAPLALGLGWVEKPAYMPRSQALPAWHRPGTQSTAGINLHYRPSRTQDLNLNLFVDPFAGEGDSLGGAQMRWGF